LLPSQGKLLLPREFLGHLHVTIVVIILRDGHPAHLVLHLAGLLPRSALKQLVGNGLVLLKNSIVFLQLFIKTEWKKP
jgi:hypothetical protein